MHTSSLLLSLSSALCRIYKYERKNRAKLGWGSVHVSNDVASLLDRADQLDLVSQPRFTHAKTTSTGVPFQFATTVGRLPGV